MAGQPAGGQHGNVVGQSIRLVHVVGAVQQRAPPRRPPQQLLHLARVFHAPLAFTWLSHEHPRMLHVNLTPPCAKARCLQQGDVRDGSICSGCGPLS